MYLHDFNIMQVIEGLSKRRKVFHSEADFQFALAWEINQLYPDIDVRLEYAYRVDDKIYHIDILILLRIKEKYIPIELKYKTKKESLSIDSEEFMLRSHGAQDLGKYDFIKDIVRLETLISKDSAFIEGYAIMLTNDSSYWKGSKRKNICCADFDIGDNKQIVGSLKWAEHTGVGTMKSREKPLV